MILFGIPMYGTDQAAMMSIGRLQIPAQLRAISAGSFCRVAFDGTVADDPCKRGVSFMTASKTLFRVTRSETRADVTDRAAREIIDAEAAARNQRIARLRSLRLQSEAAARQVSKAKPAAKPRKKAG